jgi:hypothetical protein
MTENRRGAVSFVVVVLLTAWLGIPAGPAAATDVHDLKLKSTSVRFTRESPAVDSQCVVPTGDGICAAPLLSIFSPESMAVDCSRPGCTIEFHLCLQYNVFSASGAPLFGGAVLFKVDDVFIFDRAASFLTVVDGSVSNQQQGNACFLGFASGLAAGAHTIKVQAGAEVFGGVPGDRATMDIRSANLAIRVYAP